MSSRARGKHSIGVKREPIIYECIDCVYKTKSETGIKLHRKKSHKIEQTNTIKEKDLLNQCKTCRKTFNRLKETRKHVKFCHRQT